MEAAHSEWGESLISAVLFGSVARGEAGPESDVDLLLVVRGLPSGRFDRTDALGPLDDAVEPTLTKLHAQGIPARVSPVLKTPAEAEKLVLLYLDLAEDGILIVDRDDFFARILERLRQRLAELGSERRRLGRVHYWVVKPGLKPGEVIRL